jgi:hypothetical protein
VGVDSVGVDEGELGEGLFPVGGDLAFDEASFGFAFGAVAEAGFFGAVAGPFVFDGAEIIHATTGELIRELTLNPTIDYQRRSEPKPRPKPS